MSTYAQIFTTVIGIIINPVKCICPVSPRTIILDILKVIRAIIVMFIYHPVDDTFTVSTVSPNKSISIIIKAIPYLPGIQITGSKITITYMFNCSCYLIQSICTICGNNNIKYMPCGPCVCLSCSTRIVSYSV